MQKAWKPVSNIQGIDKIQREKFMSNDNKNTQLLFLTTFDWTKKLLKIS